MTEDVKTGRKPTVAHFLPWSGLGGVEIATLRMADAMRDQVRSVAFCLQDASAVRDAFEKAGVETVAYAAPEPSLRHGARYYGVSRALARQIQAAGADIVHFSEEKAAYHNSLAALLSRAKIMCHVRVSNPELILRKRLCLLPVQSFVFVSKEARRTFGVSLPDDKARVIYDAVEIPSLDIAENNQEVRHELGIDPACAVVGMVARVSPQKDYFTLAAAAEEVIAAHPATRFLVVGDNSNIEMNRRHYSEVIKVLDELNIRGSFIFTGHRTDVPRLMAAMDICVLCTNREGFPLSILESMAMRKPVVATAVGGIPEVVKPGVTGFLHQHGDSKELASRIVELIESPETAQRIAKSGYEEVRLNYSRQRFSDEMMRAYRDLL